MVIHRDRRARSRLTIVWITLGIVALLGPGAGASPTGGGTQLWVQRYNGPANDVDVSVAAAVSPDGTTVFVTGYSDGPNVDYATVAYDATTGSPRWLQRYRGPDNKRDIPVAIGVSSDGSSVIVTGYSGGATSGADVATVAYDAVTGEQRWAQRYNGPRNGPDTPASLALSPDGSMVYVTGSSGHTRTADSLTT
jgi:hypothetical protein